MTETVKAAVFRDGKSEAVFEELQVADMRENEVIVELVGTGVCHSDLTCRDGFMALPRPIILGHEGAGIIHSVGAAVTKVVPGDHVVISFLPCGECVNCKDGVPSYCFDFLPNNFTGRRPDGSSALIDSDGGDVAAHFFGQSSFAKMSVANEDNVVKVRKDAPLELLGPLGCGILTGAGAVIKVLEPKKGQSIVVFGGGGVGLSAIMAAKILGCSEIILVEPLEGRRTLAAELGATHVIDPTIGIDVTEELRKICPTGLNHAFDTSGIEAVMVSAILALGPRGKLAVVAMKDMESTLPVPLVAFVTNGITVRGVNLGDADPQVFIPQLVDYYMDGVFPFDKLVKFYDFADINQALEDQDNGTAIKPILKMG